MIKFFEQRDTSCLQYEQLPSRQVFSSEKDRQIQALKNNQFNKFQAMTESYISAKNIKIIHQRITITLLLIIFLFVMAIMNYYSWGIFVKKPVSQKKEDPKATHQQIIPLDISPIIIQAPSPVFHLKSHQSVHLEKDDVQKVHTNKVSKTDSEEHDKINQQALKMSELRKNQENSDISIQAEQSLETTKISNPKSSEQFLVFSKEQSKKTAEKKIEKEKEKTSVSRREK